MIGRRVLSIRFFAGGHHHGPRESYGAYHKELPEGSWDRHSDDEDPYYFYNKYGPFHEYTTLNDCRPSNPHNIPEEDPYRYEI